MDELDLYETNGTTVNSGESSLDIEMTISMAPGLSEVLVYEGHNSNQVNVLKRMQTDDLANQLTSSYTLYDTGDNPIFMMMAMQGQSFFLASGDSGAYPVGGGSFNDNPYVTIVGGTSPFTSSPGGPWASEVAWQNSGGGISPNYPIPSYQQGLSMALNGGSATMRNIPDVSMIAQTILCSIYGGGVTNDHVGGTSAATPLWAAFTALINQQAAANGPPPEGFLNPLIYEIGQGANYPLYFHDITMGNNTWGNSPDAYYATNGYDFVTGWGTPIGSNLIYLLAQASNSVWVDFNHSGSSPQLGTFPNPYSTLARESTR